ncbi:beta-lactamase family protein [Arenibacter sp. 6A1]|uniref:serine hydrolase domain-containing protein n=1 Tax=Arenibacter sp. 6A1 TaxID=2720391 RepID=UPI00144608B7|nr:serine hydrolase domain-containing protein [Arenibacter sp. 6A1]NKI26955.1 beta-lactamase family protein [Arenibacter sp. 6A1]
MQRFKILAGATLILLVLLGLTTNIFTPNSAPDSLATLTTAKLEKPVVDKQQVHAYKMQQQALQLAIKAYFDKAIASGDIVGAGVSIVQGDSILISSGFGKKNINRMDRVNGETIFRLGSLSKGFAGVLAANLKDEGILNWEDKVSDFIPEFQLGDQNNTHKITLANILSHTSGTPYHSYTNLVEAGLPLVAIAERFSDVMPNALPGSMYSYQNAMFALCGEMMYKVTGQEIGTALAERILNPLGMCSTLTDYESLAKAPNVAKPHVKSRNGYRTSKLTDNYYNAIAAGGINSSAGDMAKWMRFLLGHNPEIMSKTALEETFNPFIEIKGSSKYYHRWPGHLKSYYAFGWRIHTYLDEDSKEEKTIWHHGGSVNNFRNEIALYPDADLGICVLLNSHSRLAQTVIPELHQIVQEVFGSSNATMAHNSKTNTTASL